MKCPEEVQEILANILLFGFIAIQSRSHDADFCRRVAYHLHNLPSILIHYTPGRLHYYWHNERAGFLREATPQDVRVFQHWWDLLEPHIPAENSIEPPAPALQLAA